MAPDVLLRKLTYLRQLLVDLAPFEGATLAEVEAEQNLTPDSYRQAFKLAGERELLPADLAERLQEAAAMRNVLVHLYQEIDYEILRNSISPALRDFGQFLAFFAAELNSDEAVQGD